MRPGVVAEAQRAAEALAEIAQRGVAGLVALLVVDDLEVVEVEQHERERPPVAGAARDRHLEQAVEAAPVVQAGERVVPGVVAQHVEPQREHAQRQHQRAVEGVVVERGPGVEAGRGDEQLLVVGAERPAAGAEHLQAEARFFDHDRGVVELELLDEGVERLVDERDAGLAGRDRRGEILAERAHPLHPDGASLPSAAEFVARCSDGPGNSAPSPRATPDCCDTNALPGPSQRPRPYGAPPPSETLIPCARSIVTCAPRVKMGRSAPFDGNVRFVHPERLSCRPL